MAITKTIEIKVKTDSATESLKSVNNEFNGLEESALKSISGIEKNVNGIDKSLKNTEKSTKSLADGFKGVGLAIKAIGIGLVLDAFNILKDLFMSNQKIADVFGASIKSLGIVFNDLFNFINKNIKGVSDVLKNLFENPLESIKSFGKLIKENIIERFNSALEVAGFLSTALVKLFKGDFEGAVKSVKEAGKEMVDVFTGVDDTVGKVGNLANAVGKYASEVWNSAAALQAQENAAKRAVAIQAGLVEQYDRQAEKLRQIRDNDLSSIDERIKANNDLGVVLEKQQKAMLAQAALQVKAAQNQFNLNKSIDNEVALIDARNNVKAVEAQIEGFRSEQIVNRIALEKESLDLAKSRTQAESELSINQKLFEAERLKDESKKLKAQKQAIEEERNIELERLSFNITLYKEGTQARIDAENEYNLRKQELDNAIILKEDEIRNYRALKEKEFNEKRITEQKLLNDQLINAEIALQNAKRNSLDTGLAILQDFSGKNKALALGILAIQKGLAIADIIVGAKKSIALATAALGQANAGALATPQAIASGGIAALPVIAKNTAVYLKSVAGTKISAATNIAAILAAGLSGGASVGGGGAPSGGDAGGGSPRPERSAPQLNIVGNTGVNQVAQVLNRQQAPIKAFVVANDVTTQQGLDRQIKQTATLG